MSVSRRNREPGDDNCPGLLRCTVHRHSYRPSGFPARARRDGFTFLPRRKATRAARAGEGRRVTSRRRLGRTSTTTLVKPMGLLSLLVLAQETEGAVGHWTTRQRARCGDGDSARGRSATREAVRRRRVERHRHGCGGGAEIEAAGRGLSCQRLGELCCGLRCDDGLFAWRRRRRRARIRLTSARRAKLALPCQRAGGAGEEAYGNGMDGELVMSLEPANDGIARHASHDALPVRCGCC